MKDSLKERQQGKAASDGTETADFYNLFFYSSKPLFLFSV